VIGDEHADAALFQIGDELADVADGDGVDSGERFIEQHEFRARGEGAGDFNAAAFAA
jgi:hypothetical protein